MKFLTIIILFAFSYTHSHNEFVTIKFQNLEYLESGWKGKEFHFKINGVVIQADTIQHKISIIKKKLDVIFFLWMVSSIKVI